jgi:hypothetical protein
VYYEGLGGTVGYSTYMPWNYGDNRGAEVTITKNRGRFLRGFLNFTYLQRKGGDFGYANFYENSFDMRNYLRTSTDYRQWLPIAEPFARMNLIFLTPGDFGPDFAGGKPLGDWRVSLLGEWRSGSHFTWAGGATYPELQENVKWRDYINFDLRFTKHLNTSLGSAQLFLDISNVFNRKHLYQDTAFHEDNRDQDYYMWSLHLPADIYDTLNNPDQPPSVWIPGDDQPGDFRDRDVAFQPIEAYVDLAAAEGSSPNEYAWYWTKDTGDYFRWRNGAWETVPDGEVKKVLDTKAYIDMPNLTYKTFLNPRRFTLGIRVSF